MSLTRIDATGELANFSLKADLDGRTYSIRFAWNPRLAAWYLDLGDESEATWFIQGERLEPFVPDPANLAALPDLTEDDLYARCCVFGRFFRPGYLLATAPAPVTTQGGLSTVDFVYSDQAEFFDALAEALAE